MPDFSAMPEVFVSNADLAAAVSREVKDGLMRKIGSRLYTRNSKTRRNRSCCAISGRWSPLIYLAP
jgi:hypothetical protein